MPARCATISAENFRRRRASLRRAPRPSSKRQTLGKSDGVVLPIRSIIVYVSALRCALYCFLPRGSLTTTALRVRRKGALEPAHSFMKGLLSQMCIPGAHLNRLVSSELLNHLQVFSSHRQTRAECVSVVMPSVVDDLSVFHCRLEPILRIFNWEHQCVPTGRLLALRKLLHSAQDSFIHRDHTRRAVLRPIEIDLTALEVDVLPSKRVLL